MRRTSKPPSPFNFAAGDEGLSVGGANGLRDGDAVEGSVALAA
jgi:hypothetical protein